MYRHVLSNSTRRVLPSPSRAFIPCKGLHVNTSDLESKYADKLRLRAQEQGLSISELKEKAKLALEEEKKRLREANAQLIRPVATTSKDTTSQPKVADNQRKDSSPVKSLASILNLSRILSVNAAQVSALWTAYHASRSEGTGRGYLCASIPLESYEKMATVGSKYSSFVLPVPRPTQGSEAIETPHEFHFMQWGFHEVPPIPSAAEPDPFIPSTNTYQTPDGSTNPPTSTILFTPLQEYKIRNSYATPYLVLTHYTDLARSHGIVLLRGEITPGSGGNGRYLLSQEDAQILSMGVQRFYLWEDKDLGKSGSTGPSGESILKTFHEKPTAFDWQEMLKYSALLR